MSSVGVTGESIANIGVNGKSVKGYAVHGISTKSHGVVGTSNGDAASAGVLGTNTGSGPGIEAASISGSGLIISNGPDPNAYNQRATSPTAIINAISTFGDALDITTGFANGHDEPNAGPAIVTSSPDATANIGAGAEAISALNTAERTGGGYGPPGTGIDGSSTFGDGIVGSTESGPTAIVTGNTYPVAAVSANAYKGADLYLGFGTGTFEVTNDGNVNASGTVTSGVTCAPTTCPSGTQLIAYATRDASPTIEDLGRAQLVHGAATVLLDSAFAGAIDSARGYYVFVTPEGDTRGLYVASRTPRGFTVGESLSGHSTVAFSYRIVATPYGSKFPRLPVTRMQRFAEAAFAQQRLSVQSMKHKSAELRARASKFTMRREKSK